MRGGTFPGARRLQSRAGREFGRGLGGHRALVLRPPLQCWSGLVPVLPPASRARPQQAVCRASEGQAACPRLGLVCTVGRSHTQVLLYSIRRVDRLGISLLDGHTHIVLLSGVLSSIPEDDVRSTLSSADSKQAVCNTYQDAPACQLQPQLQLTSRKSVTSYTLPDVNITSAPPLAVHHDPDTLLSAPPHPLPTFSLLLCSATSFPSISFGLMLFRYVGYGEDRKCCHGHARSFARSPVEVAAKPGPDRVNALPKLGGGGWRSAFMPSTQSCRCH